MEYRPHKYQTKFHKSKARFRSVFAGRRSGKTVSGVVEALIQSLKYEKCNGADYRGIIVEPTYGDITRFLIPEIEKWWGYYIKSFNRSENKITLKNGFVIYLLSSLEFDRFRGNKLRWLWLDEAEYYPYGQRLWEAAFPCLTDYEGICWATTTTRGKGWTYQTFHVPAMAGDDMYETFVFRTIDNPAIPPKEIELARKTLAEKKFKVEYEASFEDFVGQIYYMFSLKDHVVDPFPIPSHWRVIKGMDIGYQHPFSVAWIAIDQYDRYFIFQEYRESERTVKENGLAVLEQDQFPGSTFMVDPSAYAVDHVSGFAKSKDLEDLNLRIMPANNSVQLGIDRVSQLLKEKRLFVFKTCVKTIEELTQYRWDENKAYQGEPKPYKEHDDLCDAIRYALVEYYAERTQHMEPKVQDTELILKEMAERRHEDIARHALEFDLPAQQDTELTIDW